MGRAKGEKSLSIYDSFCNYAAAVLYYTYNKPKTARALIANVIDFGAGRNFGLNAGAVGPAITRDGRFEHSGEKPYEYRLKDEYDSLEYILSLSLKEDLKDKVRNRPDRVEETAE